MRNQQIFDEACEWFVRMREEDEAIGRSGELMEWLRRSPEHVRAYLDIAAIWMEVPNVEVDAQLDLATRIALAKADAGVLFPGHGGPWHGSPAKAAERAREKGHGRRG